MTYEEKLARLRDSFLSKAVRRIETLRRSLERLRADPGDRASLESLVREFHALAGAAATYGSPQLSALGRCGEEACSDAYRDRTAVGHQTLETCGSLIEDIARQVDAALPQSKPLIVSTRKSFRVLVTTSDDRFAQTLMQALQSSDIAVSASSSEPPDLAVIDVDDAGDVQAVVASARRDSGARPVLAVADDISLLTRVNAVRGGADGCYNKSAEFDALVQRIRQEQTRLAEPPTRILSIEDDEDQAAYLGAILTSAGYDFRVCRSPSDVENELRSYQPDLIVMDVNLGGSITGHHVARSIRQQPRYAAVPIIFLTARDEHGSITESVTAGGDDHLVKPIAPTILLTTVAARLERARMLRHLLEHDPLTGLLTHTAFYNRATTAFLLSQRRASPAVVAMVDVDHFKSVNDRFGHIAGDRVLTVLAALIRSRIRASDAAGRYGGEEFAILMHDTQLADAQRAIDKLRQAWSETDHVMNGDTIRVTFSAGLAQTDEGYADVTAWVNAADRALYDAKRSGRNRVVVADSGPAEE
jgi:diguanylate cyclase (GGDEF)-like protein